MNKFHRNLIYIGLMLFIGLQTGCQYNQKTSNFSFDVATDMRQFSDSKHQGLEYFKGTCMAILNIGKGAFMVSPGDIDPPAYAYKMVNTILGPNYPWYPVVGNHESTTSEVFLCKWAQGA